jgi:hypothetical protein
MYKRLVIVAVAVAACLSASTLVAQCGCEPAVSYAPAYTTYYAAPQAVYYAPATPYVSYYAPSAPTYTSYYAPAYPTYYASPYVSYYSPYYVAPRYRVWRWGW